MRALVGALEDAGWPPTSVGAHGFLAERDTRTFALEVPADRCLTLVALASPGVEDLDASLYTPEGTLLAEDKQPDAHPTIQVCGGTEPRRVYYHLRSYDGAGAFVFGAHLGARARLQAASRIVGGRPGVALDVGGGAADDGGLRRLVAGVEGLGFEIDMQPQAVPLEAGQRVRLPLPVELGRCYTVAVVAAGGLDALDLRVLDAVDREVAAAEERGRYAAAQLCPSREERLAIELHGIEGQGEARMAVLSVSDAELGGERALWLGTRPDERVVRAALEGVVARERRALRAEGYRAQGGAVEGRLRPGEAASHPAVLRGGRCTALAVPAGRGLGRLWLRVEGPKGDLRFEGEPPAGSARIRLCSDRDRSVRLSIAARRGEGRYAVLVAAKPIPAQEPIRGVGPDAAGKLLHAHEEGARQGWKLLEPGRRVRLGGAERITIPARGCVRVHAVAPDATSRATVLLQEGQRTVSSGAGHVAAAEACAMEAARELHVSVRADGPASHAHLVVLQRTP